MYLKKKKNLSGENINHLYEGWVIQKFQTPVFDTSQKGGKYHVATKESK